MAADGSLSVLVLPVINVSAPVVVCIMRRGGREGGKEREGGRRGREGGKEREGGREGRNGREGGREGEGGGKEGGRERERRD